MNNSRIICAANRIILKNGQIATVAGARHWDKVMHSIVDCLDQDMMELEQGFIDQYGNFYGREEAWVIADTNGQIIRRVGGDTTLEGNGRLFSENLY